MSTMLPPLTPPTPPTPTSPEPATCARWCVDQTGHPSKDQSTEQRCRSTVHRIDSPLGGGREGNRPIAAAGVYLQAEQTAAEPPSYVLGIELGATEQWIRLRAADLHTLATTARTLLTHIPST